ACPTDSGFIADQDRATIAKSSALPHDLAPWVTSPVAEEGSMQQTLNELTNFCTSLQRQHLELLAKFQAQEVEIIRLKERVKYLEDKEGVIRDKSRDDDPIKGRRSNEGEAAAEKKALIQRKLQEDREAVATKQYGKDAPIKGRSNNEGEASAERISNDSKEIARVLTSMDAATVLARETNVPTDSGFIPTAGPLVTVIFTGSEVGPTAKEEIQGMIDSLDKSNETIAKYLQEYQEFASELPLENKIELISDLVKYQEHYTKVHKFQSQQRKPMTKKQKREYYMAVIKSKLGWRFKDFKGLSLEQESAKKFKPSEEVTEEGKSLDEVPEEKINEMMQLVFFEEVYVEALQVKHPIID
nr:hypothetical protein [Tanacetum cinerariifolium]